jgi:hypothetical protein
MVKKLEKDNKEFYICEECNFAYETKELAQKCEDWCGKNQSCSLEITKHAVKI